ncbi:MAG: L-serine ammonia-lyase, partial [Halieaceae bacterium]|nr:L-serine ammonia-lyase [Halieaceae bacterium]
MSISIFDLFKVGIGPSSSHTVGPMNAARSFALGLSEAGLLPQCHRVVAELYGSLGATGAGHGSPKAVILGLEGETPEGVDVGGIAERLDTLRNSGKLHLLGSKTVKFSYDNDLLLHRAESLPFHSNGMRFSAYDTQGEVIYSRVYYSVGGGFILDETAAEGGAVTNVPSVLAHPFGSGAELLARCKDSGLSISALMMENEKAWRSEEDIR